MEIVITPFCPLNRKQSSQVRPGSFILTDRR